MALKRLTAERFAEAHSPAQFPESPLPEIALAGRSNVGKSSLLNALCGQQKLARTSKTPGRTRALHFFRTDAGFTLVDLPGYGFAQGDPKERIAWKALIESYITARPQLRAVVVLVDSRHEPSREDRGIFDWLNALQKNALCVATKADKLSGNEKVRAAAMLKRSLKLNHEPILFSAINGLGREALVVKLKALTQS